MKNLKAKPNLKQPRQRRTRRSFTQVSPRGQVTLPAELRKKLDIHPGDPLSISEKDGTIVLSPAVLIPVERYTNERIKEFDQANQMTAEELKIAGKAWQI